VTVDHADDFRERLLYSIAETEVRLAAHPKDCGGCPGCPRVGMWGDLLHLATMRVALRNLDRLTGEGVGG
jgi:hypothetical protein